VLNAFNLDNVNTGAGDHLVYQATTLPPGRAHRPWGRDGPLPGCMGAAKPRLPPATFT
jgi:hypothetical protein